MKKRFLVSIAFLLTSISYAQDFNRQKMDSLFMLVEQNQAGMGSLSIFKNGKEVYHNAIGYADVEAKKEKNENTKYRIGSISKMFTAVLTMQLVESGKLNLETKLSEFYPELPNASKITIENLLRHQSGLYNFVISPDYLEYMHLPKTKTELLEIFKQDTPVFEPGIKTEYSNTNYVLLTFIIEEITGKDFAEVLKTEIVQPLQLQNTYYGGKIDVSMNETFSYQKLSDWVIMPETHMSIPQGAGAIVSTPADVNKFLFSLFNNHLVKENTLKDMQTFKEGFGIGMFEIPFYDKISYGHTGGIDGFQTITSYFPEERVAVSYFSNGTSMPINEIILGVLNIYFNKVYELPSFKPEYAVDSQVLKQYAGVYSTADFPLKITIFVEGSTLFAQATGQSSFPLEAYEENKFKFSPAGIKMEFLPEDGKMKFEQSGMKFTFSRE